MGFFDFLFKKKKVSVMYGYPKGESVWLTIYHHRKKNKWIFEWDDLFDDGKPKSWGDGDFMYVDKKSGATPEEHAYAKKLLKNRGY